MNHRTAFALSFSLSFSLLLSGLPGQDPQAPKKPPKAGTFNSAVGLGGGAGGKFGGRGAGRGRLGKKAVDLARAIELGLTWLKQHQDADGRWDADGFAKHDTEGDPSDGPGAQMHDVGVTGLALLAFLGDGTTLRSGPHRDVVKKGIAWLRSQQGEDGAFGDAAARASLPDQAIATWAMVEAYGLSQYKLLKKNAQRGIDFLESRRKADGVWHTSEGTSNTPLVGWCVMAYCAANDFKLTVDAGALPAAAAWFERTTDPETARCGHDAPGSPPFRKPGEHSQRFPSDLSEAPTAVALLSRFFLGHKPSEHPIMQRSADLLVDKLPVWNEKDGSIDHYYWYQATYALYQMGGQHWKKWSASLHPVIVMKQRRDGNFKGSWDPVGVWGEDGGRVYSTATLVLTLEAYYRYTRLVR